jgi:uncharacterized membrane protein
MASGVEAEASMDDELDQPEGAGFVSPKTVALYGVLTALTAAVTFATFIYFAPTKGYFNMGDSMVFFSAFAFGWRAGAICGGVGSAAADVLLGAGFFAPYTFVAKGSEGLVAGLIGRLNGGSKLAKTLGVAAGGTCMVVTYLLCEVYLLDFGWGAALAEAPGNVIQVIVGGIVGTLLAYYVKRVYQPSAGTP